MEKKKILGALLIVLVAAAVVGAYVLWSLRKVQTTPVVAAIVFINGQKVVDSASPLSAAPLSIFTIGGRPLVSLKIYVKLIWHVRALSERGKYEIPSETQVEYIAVAFWRIKGWYGWYAAPLGQLVKVERGTEDTLWAFVQDYTTANPVLQQILEAIGASDQKIWCGWAISTKTGAGQYATYFIPMSYLAATAARYQYARLVAEKARQVLMAGRVVEEADSKNPVQQFLDFLAKQGGVIPAPVKMRDGSKAVLYVLETTGPELQRVLGSAPFSTKIELGWNMFQQKYLITDVTEKERAAGLHEGQVNIKMELCVFIAYRFMDLNGRWSPWIMACKPLVTLQFTVSKGYWTSVSVTAAATGTISGAWTVEPP